MFIQEGKYNTSTAPLQEPFAAMQWIFVKVPLLPVWVCLPTHKPVKEVIETLKTLQRKSGTAFSRATSLTSLGSRLCFGPLFQLSVQRFAFLNVWIIVNPRAIKGGKVHLWNCYDLYHSHVLPTNDINFRTSLSKSQNERDSMCQIRSSLLSLLGCERGWIASPGASRSAERRDTSAMVFEDSLQTSHIRHGPEHAMRHGDAKQSTGRKSQSAAIWNPIWNPRWSRCASCNSAAFSSETLAYKMFLWDQFSNNGPYPPYPPVICLPAWGTNMLKKRQGLCFGSLFQVPVEFPGFLWRHESSKKSIHGCMFQIKTCPNTALTQTHPTHPAPRAERSSERPLKWTSDVPDTSHCCKKTTFTIT